MSWTTNFLRAAGNAGLVAAYYDTPGYSPKDVRSKITKLESNEMFLNANEQKELEHLRALSKARANVPGSKYPGGQYKTRRDPNKELQGL